MDTNVKRNIGLREIIQVYIKSGFENIHTMLPAKIESYDPATQVCSATPLLGSIRYQTDGTYRKQLRSVIEDIPVVFPRNSDFFLTFPLKQGDLVMLVFCMNSLDNFFEPDGQNTDPRNQNLPDDPRMHDISDPVAMPGFYPPSLAIQDIDTENMAIGKDNGGTQIKIKPEGGLDITFDNGTSLSVGAAKDGDATLTVGDGSASVAIAEEVISYLSTFVNSFNAHTHPTAFGPSGTPVSPATAPDGTLTSANVKIPNANEAPDAP